MTPGPQRLDVFCRVVDNLGDAGVALRLSRQLVHEHAIDVTLWIDDVGRLSLIASGVDQHRADQRHAGIRVRRWPDAALPADATMPDVVVEAFGCGLPAPYLDAMERVARPPVWVNLEYLSAEAWVDDVHALPSPHPRRALQRWFLFPGFSARSGGLLREKDLFASRDGFQRDAQSRVQPWTSLGLPEPPPDALHVSLFCYANPAIDTLLETWRDEKVAIACLMPHGVAGAAVARVLGGDAAAPGQARRVGSLTLGIAPFVDQPAFDRRLWASDLNIGRGEDSFVRAQWAARPFVWHIYPQAERAHVAKLAAFLDRYAADVPQDARAPLVAFWSAFNDGNGPATASAWPALRDALPMLRGHALAWSTRLAEQPDLATQLVDFARGKL